MNPDPAVSPATAWIRCCPLRCRHHGGQGLLGNTLRDGLDNRAPRTHQPLREVGVTEFGRQPRDALVVGQQVHDDS